MRPSSSHHVATTEPPKQLPKIPKDRLTQHLKRKHKGQKVAPNLQAEDEGLATRARLYATADNGYQAINRSWTRTWLRHRLKEYVEIHGYASAGVCALLERAAEQYADGDFLRASIASSGSQDIAEGLHQAARHAQLARSHELAAWELAAREGAAKKVHDGTGISGMSNRNGKLAERIREHPASGQEGEGAWEGGVEADPPSTFAPPGGVEGQGPPSPSPIIKTDSPLPSPPIPKPSLYTYCEGCSRNFKEKVCPRCGANPPAPAIVAPEDVTND